MPIYTFDITDKCISFVKESIKDMPGNAGQETLVNDLSYAGSRFLASVNLELDGDVSVSSNYLFRTYTPHPEAIEIILDEAEKNAELITRQSEILGPWDLTEAIETGDWKIVGWDLEWQ
jgi:hypothetical protein